MVYIHFSQVLGDYSNMMGVGVKMTHFRMKCRFELLVCVIVCLFSGIVCVNSVVKYHEIYRPRFASTLI